MKSTKILLLFLIISVFVYGQNENNQTKIPNDLIGSWVIMQKREGQVPSQIFRWIFTNSEMNKGESEFHWLFKRLEDKDFITVAALVGKLNVKNDKFFSTTTKVGTMQKEPMVMEFYETVKWYFPGDPMFEKFPKEESRYFEIIGDVLKLKQDNNLDGDFNDEGEVQEYMRESEIVNKKHDN